MIAFDDDLGAFFDTDGFADTATVAIGEAEPFTVAGIFDTRPPFTSTNFKGFHAATDFGRGLGKASGSKPRFTCASSAIAAVKPSRVGDATLTIRGVAYVVDDIEADGTGVSIITLTKA